LADQTITADQTSTAHQAKPFVVRVSGIQCSNALQAETFVKTTIERLSVDGRDCISNITIIPSCTNDDTLVALVDFSKLPDALSSLKSGRQKSHTVRMAESYLTFEVEFLGFTQMYPTKTNPNAE
jgi:hypothetical protein